MAAPLSEAERDLQHHEPLLQQCQKQLAISIAEPVATLKCKYSFVNRHRVIAIFLLNLIFLFKFIFFNIYF